ncbi:hypothetical protein HNP72_002829 [Sphingobacterium soli]|nr:hypothetical protein [Sphingobacterium soli]
MDNYLLTTSFFSNVNRVEAPTDGTPLSNLPHPDTKKARRKSSFFVRLCLNSKYILLNTRVGGRIGCAPPGPNSYPQREKLASAPRAPNTTLKLLRIEPRFESATPEHKKSPTKVELFCAVVSKF